MNEISHIQLAVMDILRDGQEKAGSELRTSLDERGHARSLPGFYQVMARMESNGYVEGLEREKIIGNRPYKHRSYRITTKGHEVYDNYKDSLKRALNCEIIQGKG